MLEYCIRHNHGADDLIRNFKTIVQKKCFGGNKFYEIHIWDELGGGGGVVS